VIEPISGTTVRSALRKRPVPAGAFHDEATNLIKATKSTDLRGVGCSGWLLLKYLPTSGFAPKK